MPGVCRCRTVVRPLGTVQGRNAIQGRSAVRSRGAVRSRTATGRRRAVHRGDGRARDVRGRSIGGHGFRLGRGGLRPIRRQSACLSPVRRRCGHGLDRGSDRWRARIQLPIRARAIDRRSRRAIDVLAARLCGTGWSRAHAGGATGLVWAPMGGVMRSTVMAPAHRLRRPSRVARAGEATPKRRCEVVVMRSRIWRRDASGATRRPMIPQPAREKADPRPRSRVVSRRRRRARAAPH